MLYYKGETLITDRIPYAYTLQVYIIILICIYYYLLYYKVVVRGISEWQLRNTTCIEVHQRRRRRRRAVQLHPFTAVDCTYIPMCNIQFMRSPLTWYTSIGL